MTVSGNETLFWGDKNDLKWTVVTVAQCCDYTRNHCIYVNYNTIEQLEQKSAGTWISAEAW